jgi:hypothetical protein
MDEKASFRPFLMPTLVLLVVGWGGLALLMSFTRPELWPRWAFFALTVMAFTGTALPLSFLLNQRLMSNETGVVTRQAMWVGIYVAILAWLKIGQVLNFSVALWLVLVFLGLEYLLYLRARAVRPPVADE